jgi:phage recombination protein Bet
MSVSTARSRAVANETRQIDASQQRAIAAREAQVAAPRPRNALEAMSSRLEVSPGALKETLMRTVFSTCRNDSEFIALVIVSNTYGLNPLLKEIYAFPAKGGGVVPMVSVDGWIKLMHSHPAYDSIEFEDIADDKGVIYAIEATIYRTDKSRPTKIIEYLDECRRNTDPWKQSPSRMLRHRALIQCARVAFGFSGLSAPEENVVEGVGQPMDEPKILPSAQTMGEQLGDAIPTFDDEHVDEATGELARRDSRGMSEVDEETARQLDAGNDGAFSPENPNAREGRDDSQMGEQHVAEEDPIWLAQVRDIEAKVRNAATVKAIDAVERDWTGRVMNGVSDEGVVRDVEKAIAAKKRKLQQEVK